MQSISDMPGSTSALTCTDRLVAGYAALAISIHLLESAIPMPLPGVKPGLANVVVLIVLLRHGFRLAFGVALLRIVVGSILLGTFLTPTFFLSMAGGLAAVLAAGVVAPLAPRIVSAVGIAIVMAMSHMAGQFLAAWQLFVPHPALLNLLPVLLALALGLGFASGIITNRILEHLQQRT